MEEAKESIRTQALALGATRCGFAAAAPVDASAIALYDSWIAQRRHGGMHYCARYAEQRGDPRLLLDGAKTIISCAFCYNTPNPPSHIARYALGDDYHYVVKDRLKRLGVWIEETYGGSTRAMVDTAPMRERYWAQRAGVGFVGINNQLIIPGLGSYFFLGELLWTGEVRPDEPCVEQCQGCMACVRACPGRALDGQGGCDASRCISYLTIEHRGSLPEGADLAGWIYGCDVCQRVCPHNAVAQCTQIPEFSPNPEIASLDGESLSAMTSSHYRKLTRNSAMSRATLSQMLRNCACHPDGACL